MVLHVFTSFLGGVPLCIPYGSYSRTLLGGTTWRTLEGYSGRVLSDDLGNNSHGNTIQFVRAYRRVNSNHICVALGKYIYII